MSAVTARNCTGDKGPGASDRCATLPCHVTDTGDGLAQRVNMFIGCFVTIHQNNGSVDDRGLLFDMGG